MKIYGLALVQFWQEVDIALLTVFLVHGQQVAAKNHAENADLKLSKRKRKAMDSLRL